MKHIFFKNMKSIMLFIWVVSIVLAGCLQTSIGVQASSVPDTSQTNSGVLYVQYENYTVNDYEEYLNDNKAPLYDGVDEDGVGYLFGGWYDKQDSGYVAIKDTSDLDNIQGDIVAKFVPAQTLSVKCQNWAGTNEDSNDVVVRVISALDTTNYSQYGFVVSKIVNGTETLLTKKCEVINPIAKYEFQDAENPGKDTMGNYDLITRVSDGLETGSVTVSNGIAAFNGTAGLIPASNEADISEDLQSFTVVFEIQAPETPAADWATPIGFGWNDWTATKWGNFQLAGGSDLLRFTTHSDGNESAYWGKELSRISSSQYSTVILSAKQGGKMVIYVDGVQRYSHDLPADYSLADSDMRFALGGSSCWGNVYHTFSGSLADVRVYDFAFGEEQIHQYLANGDVYDEQIEPFISKDVYSRFNYYQSTTDTDPDVYSPKDLFGAAAEHFITCTVGYISKEAHNAIICIKPFWDTLDGTRVYGLSKYAHVEDGYKGYVNVPVNLNILNEDTVAAAGYLTITSRTEGLTFLGIENGVEYGKVFDEMECSIVDGVIKCVGNTSDVSDIKNNDIYINLKFQRDNFDCNNPTVDTTFYRFNVENEKFCSSEEEVIDSEKSNVWNVKY